jgi:hypothetical protein
MRDIILKAIINFSRDEDLNKQKISPTVFGFLADEIEKEIKASMCEVNAYPLLYEGRRLEGRNL